MSISIGNRKLWKLCHTLLYLYQNCLDVRKYNDFKNATSHFAIPYLYGSCKW